MKSLNKIVWQILISALVVCALGPYTNPAFAQVVFEDGFESGDLGRTQNGFEWLSPNRTTIVRDDQYVVWANRESQLDGPYFGREWENAPDSGESHALRFHYPAETAMSEQRFALNAEYGEVWISYWLRVPINYKHGTIGKNPGYRNQKLLSFWAESYSGSEQPRVTLNMWDDRNAWSEDGDSGISYSTVTYRARNMVASHKDRFGNFIRFPEDQGRWMHVVLYAKVSSAPGIADGVFRWWRRWSDEAEYTVLANRSGLDWTVDQGFTGFSAGYLMGWANGAYEENTEFLLDDFKVSRTSLLEGVALPPRSPSSVGVD